MAPERHVFPLAPVVRRRAAWLALCLALCLAAGIAVGANAAAPPAAPKPKILGKFSDWTAATMKLTGKTICYAYASSSGSASSAGAPGEALLNVSRLGKGPPAVVLAPGVAAAKDTAISVAVGSHKLSFSEGGTPGTAIARDPNAVIEAFKSGAKVVATLSRPNHRDVADSFSLQGFSEAYAAMTKACTG
jgi:invasion protein IalB